METNNPKSVNILTPKEVEDRVKAKGFQLATKWERENLDPRELFSWRDPETGLRYRGGEYLVVEDSDYLNTAPPSLRQPPVN